MATPLGDASGGSEASELLTDCERWMEEKKEIVVKGTSVRGSFARRNGG